MAPAVPCPKGEHSRGPHSPGAKCPFVVIPVPPPTPSLAAALSPTLLRSGLSFEGRCLFDTERCICCISLEPTLIEERESVGSWHLGPYQICFEELLSGSGMRSSLDKSPGWMVSCACQEQEREINDDRFSFNLVVPPPSALAC